MAIACNIAVHVPNPPHPCDVPPIFFENLRWLTLAQLVYSLFGLLFELQEAFGVVARLLAWWRSRQTVHTEQLAPPQPAPQPVPQPAPQSLQERAQSAYQVVKETLGGFLEQPGVRSKMQSVAAAALFAVDLVARLLYTATATSARTIYFMEFAYPMLSALATVAVLCALKNETPGQTPRPLHQQPLLGLLALHTIRVGTITLGDCIFALQKL